jgi:histidinol-phosphatase (PHP family)
MAAMCRAAVVKGIPEIGFTEHYDLHPDEDGRDWFRLEPWAAELERCQQQFADRLVIRGGIEIGEPHVFQAETKEMLRSYPFDYALGSLHWVVYFQELERMARVGGFDILSHFDVPVRVGWKIYGHYNPLEHEEFIRPVLERCIEQGIALDINTAALRRSANILTPGEEILSWFSGMGGERVTLGSDAHRSDHVGAGLELALESTRAAGLKYVTQFEQRQARMVKIG